MGKPITDSRGEVAMVAEVLHFYAGAVDKHRGATIPVAGGVDLTFHEPLGVVVAIVPWNFPLAITSWKVGPALATGNTVVVKPAEIDPADRPAPGRAGPRGRMPEGVLQVVVGQGSVVGTRLVEHPDVAKVAFTGSTAVGREVMARAAGTIKRVTLELGGSRPSSSSPMPTRAGGGGHPRRGLRQCRPGLLRPEPDPGPAFGVRPFPRAVGGAVGAVAGRRPDRPDHRDGAAGLRRSPPGVAGFLGRDGHPAGARSPSTRGRCPRDRVVVPSHRGGAGRHRVAPGPGGDLRPGGGRDPLRRRGGRGAAGQRHALRVVRLDLDPRRGPGPAHGPGRRGRQPVGELEQLGAGQTSFGGMKQSGFGRELGLEALDAYTDIKNVFIADDG